MQRSQSPVVGLIASCRALQNMLGERFSSPLRPLEATVRPRPMASPFGAPTPPPLCAPAPRGLNKRGRDEFEEEDLTPTESELSRSPEEIYSTPKRRRVMPFDLPQGLMASDFEALAETGSSQYRAPPRQRKEPQDVEMPTNEYANQTPAATPQHIRNAWTDTDDRLLVETVLSKLNLSSREWNDCAMRLGEDKDSLGRRWQLLLGEGDVGLRRGTRRIERVDLDIRSW